MAWNEQGIQTYVRDLITPLLISSYTTVRPLFSIIAGRSKEKLDKFGSPEHGMFIGGRRLGIGKRAEIGMSNVHKFRYLKAQVDSPTHVEAGGETPVATGYAEDNVGTAGVVWTSLWNPIKVRENSILAVENGGGTAEEKNLKIASVIEEAVMQGFPRQLDKHQAQLWNGTLTADQQDTEAQIWPGHIGLRHWVSDGVSSGETDYTHVGGVDRTAHTQLAANVVDASADLNSTVISTRLIRQLKYTTGGAIATKYQGAGDLMILTPDLWEKLAHDVDDKHTFYDTSIPQIGMTGFKNPVLMIDNTVVAFDPDCPEGEAYLLTTDEWCFETQKSNNFQIGSWVKDWEVTQGGKYERWTNIRAHTRLICRRPDVQTKVKNLTVS